MKYRDLIGIDEFESILLPMTPKHFDVLIKALVKRYRLPSAEHAAAVVANRIQHLPPEQAWVTMKYLGDCVRKNIAYQIAQNKSQQAQHKVQVDQLEAALKTNPYDQQARDHLEKAASEGSHYAKATLDRLGLGPSLPPLNGPGAKVIEMPNQQTGEETTHAVSSDPA